MKRLLRISFNAAIFSFVPILSWFILGIFIDENISNVFSITYPIQFIWLTLLSIFATGANICKEKDKNENAVLSGMTLGIIVGFIVFGTIILNLKTYLEFMNMDYETYKLFTLFSILQLYIQLIFAMIQEKLYYENEDKKASKYSVLFNGISLIVLFMTTIITRNQYIIIISTLTTILLFTIILLFKTYKKFKFSFNILVSIKYESVNISTNILFFFIYIFGLSNVFDYGIEYAAAFNFIALITDTQWDSFSAISTTAKIDICQNKFNYKIHKKNSYKLLSILMLSSFILFIIFYKSYNPILIITLIYFSLEIVTFFLYPIYTLKTCYLQLTDLYTYTTSNKIVAQIIRLLSTKIKSPFCTNIGAIGSCLYQFISSEILFNKYYKIESDGTISAKQ